MQEAFNCTYKWATDWRVTINSPKTEATCCSLSNTKETYKLTVTHQCLPREETPTYLGVKLDRKIN